MNVPYPLEQTSKGSQLTPDNNSNCKIENLHYAKTNRILFQTMIADPVALVVRLRLPVALAVRVTGMGGVLGQGEGRVRVGYGRGEVRAGYTGGVWVGLGEGRVRVGER